MAVSGCERENEKWGKFVVASNDIYGEGGRWQLWKEKWRMTTGGNLFLPVMIIMEKGKIAIFGIERENDNIWKFVVARNDNNGEGKDGGVGGRKGE